MSSRLFPLSRRALLKSGGLGMVVYAAGSLGVGPPFLLRTAAAETRNSGGRRKTLVTIFQRGAMDGLMAVTPLTEEKRLRRLRPRLAMTAARSAQEPLIDLGNDYGLHPALAPLVPLWKDGRLAVVHEVGSPDPTRSHFDAQDFMESGTPGRKGTPSGWLNRVAGELGHEAGPFRAVSMTPAMPRALYGDEPTLAVSRLEDFRLPGGAVGPTGIGPGFESLYESTSQGLLRRTGAETFEAMSLLAKLDLDHRGSGSSAVSYPAGALADALRQIAVLVKADVGLEIAFAESGGWDTHVQQGGPGGSFARQGRQLAQAIAAFWEDLGTHCDDVLLVTMTEFGRTVRENGSAGTDHGHGSCLFALGRDVAGGRVHGRPGSLSPDRLFEGRDLPVTTDFRSVFSGLVRDHLGVDAAGVVFPGWDGEPLDLLRRG